jgi:DNA-directed RNA polymerase specialized sigma24 family protein
VATARELYESGLTVRQIADQIGCSIGKAHALLTAAGYEPRSKGRRPLADDDPHIDKALALFEEGLQYRDVAAEMGCSLSAAYRYVQRGRTRAP